MELLAFGQIIFISIVFCLLGSEIVERYRPDTSKNLIHAIHIAYGIVLVALLIVY